MAKNVKLTICRKYLLQFNNSPNTINHSLNLGS